MSIQRVPISSTGLIQSIHSNMLSWWMRIARTSQRNASELIKIHATQGQIHLDITAVIRPTQANEEDSDQYIVQSKIEERI